MSTPNHQSRMDWLLNIAGYFLILLGLIWGACLLIGYRANFADGDVLRVLLFGTACCCLCFFGCGLLKKKLWAKIGGAFLGVILALFFLDMMAMFAFHRNSMGLWLSVAGLLMSLYTLVVIAIVRK